MILHLPHASRHIPKAIRAQFVLDDHALGEELLRVTDAFTDELFVCPGACRVISEVSRLVVDVERFSHDRDEPMSRVGQGMIYTQTCLGEPLRRALSEDERRLLKSAYYVPHHELLRRAVLDELLAVGRALIVDCHSFPSRPLPCDENRDENRPDFCIGTDAFHTPPGLLQAVESAVRGNGYTIGVNLPYSGTLVPSAYHRKNPNVWSVMVEVNRNLYMDEKAGTKSPGFESVKDRIQAVLKELAAFGTTAKGPGCRDEKRQQTCGLTKETHSDNPGSGREGRLEILLEKYK
jgi:N-formylglutamate amidohydrolase